ncbi:hypothetical protein KSP40_PGU005561 [Platanthera guangdongensis]|uniref:Uncharacterized protein n=1 Tax=Platanthera guangdongensis TaxID=2320717 RepID=A0ABR2N0A8_9ASPA
MLQPNSFTVQKRKNISTLISLFPAREQVKLTAGSPRKKKKNLTTRPILDSGSAEDRQARALGLAKKRRVPPGRLVPSLCFTWEDLERVKLGGGEAETAKLSPRFGSGGILCQDPTFTYVLEMLSINFLQSPRRWGINNTYCHYSWMIIPILSRRAYSRLEPVKESMLHAGSLDRRGRRCTVPKTAIENPPAGPGSCYREPFGRCRADSTLGREPAAGFGGHPPGCPDPAR